MGFMIRWEHTVSVLMNTILSSVCAADHCRAFKSNPSWGQKGEEGCRGSRKEIHISRRRLESQRARGKDAEWKLALRGWWQSLSPPSLNPSPAVLSPPSAWWTVERGGYVTWMCMCVRQKLMCIPVSAHVSFLSWASRWVCKWHVWEMEREREGRHMRTDRWNNTVSTLDTSGKT